jgi:hypothetical protein
MSGAAPTSPPTSVRVDDSPVLHGMPIFTFTTNGSIAHSASEDLLPAITPGIPIRKFREEPKFGIMIRRITAVTLAP